VSKTPEDPSSLEEFAFQSTISRSTSHTREKLKLDIHDDHRDDRNGQGLKKRPPRIQLLPTPKFSLSAIREHEKRLSKCTENLSGIRKA
jgi:hypothetical protein